MIVPFSLRAPFPITERVVKLEYAIHIKMTLKTGDHLRMTLPLVIKSPDEYATWRLALPFPLYVCSLRRPSLLAMATG